VNWLLLTRALLVLQLPRLPRLHLRASKTPKTSTLATSTVKPLGWMWKTLLCVNYAMMRLQV